MTWVVLEELAGSTCPHPTHLKSFGSHNGSDNAKAADIHKTHNNRTIRTCLRPLPSTVVAFSSILTYSLRLYASNNNIIGCWYLTKIFSSIFLKYYCVKCLLKEFYLIRI